MAKTPKLVEDMNVGELKKELDKFDVEYKSREPRAELAKKVTKARRKAEKEAAKEAASDPAELEVTQELLDLNPDWVKDGVTVGDIIEEPEEYNKPDPNAANDAAAENEGPDKPEESTDDSDDEEEDDTPDEVKGGTVYHEGAKGKHVVVRVYNKDDHGPKFKELAEEFAAKKGYKVK